MTSYELRPPENYENTTEHYEPQVDSGPEVDEIDVDDQPDEQRDKDSAVEVTAPDDDTSTEAVTDSWEPNGHETADDSHSEDTDDSKTEATYENGTNDTPAETAETKADSGKEKVDETAHIFRDPGNQDTTTTVRDGHQADAEAGKQRSQDKPKEASKDYQDYQAEATAEPSNSRPKEQQKVPTDTYEQPARAESREELLARSISDKMSNLSGAERRLLAAHLGTINTVLGDIALKVMVRIEQAEAIRAAEAAGQADATPKTAPDEPQEQTAEATSETTHANEPPSTPTEVAAEVAADVPAPDQAPTPEPGTTEMTASELAGEEMDFGKAESPITAEEGEWDDENQWVPSPLPFADKESAEGRMEPLPSSNEFQEVPTKTRTDPEASIEDSVHYDLPAAEDQAMDVYTGPQETAEEESARPASVEDAQDPDTPDISELDLSQLSDVELRDAIRFTNYTKEMAGTLTEEDRQLAAQVGVDPDEHGSYGTGYEGIEHIDYVGPVGPVSDIADAAIQSMGDIADAAAQSMSETGAPGGDGEDSAEEYADPGSYTAPPTSEDDHVRAARASRERQVQQGNQSAAASATQEAAKHNEPTEPTREPQDKKDKKEWGAGNPWTGTPGEVGGIPEPGRDTSDDLPVWLKALGFVTKAAAYVLVAPTIAALQDVKVDNPIPVNGEKNTYTVKVSNSKHTFAVKVKASSPEEAKKKASNQKLANAIRLN